MKYIDEKDLPVEIKNNELPKDTDKHYKMFYDEAMEEEFTQIARLFQGVGAIEHSHEMRFSALLNNLENDKIFNKENSVMWECRSCGHIYTGTSAPKVCPICGEDISYFQVYNNTFKEK